MLIRFSKFVRRCLHYNMMDCVGHEGDGGKCWTFVNFWKVLGNTYTLLDFSSLIESVGH